MIRQKISVMSVPDSRTVQEVAHLVQQRLCAALPARAMSRTGDS
jgi:hypothetical protein